jgi:MoxR-like ATPase
MALANVHHVHILKKFHGWLAALWKRLAESSQIVAPSWESVREQRANDVEIALLDALAEEERSRHTVATATRRVKHWATT